MLGVVRGLVGAAVSLENSWIRPRVVPVIVLGRAADAGKLPEERVLAGFPEPRRLAAITRAEPEEPGQRVVRVVLVMRPFLGGWA